MPLAAGETLGFYEILSPLGAGGMGEVYRARDAKLGREVAIKVLPEEFTQHPDKLARFEREARLLAALNHPGIATLHGLEEAEGKPFLVMELVEGETLAERIARGPLAVNDALALSQQIAEALEAAHEKGVIHRDLKPANIKVDPEGHVKVLDFGLAKAFAEETPESDASFSPTLSREATQAGVILGTAAYMSPEQAKGKTVDKRSDIFSFGIVLFEMLTGTKAFGGGDVPEVLAGIINKEPDWKALPSDGDPRIQNLLRRCLRKDRKKRLQAIGDARVEIEDIVAGPAGGAHAAAAVVVAQPAWRRALPFAAGAVVSGLVVGVAAWSLWPRPEPRAVNRFAVALPAEQPFRNAGRNVMAFSRDGRHVVINTIAGLSLRPMDALETQLIPGTEDGTRSPFFSPDGQALGYWADGQLKRVALSGGAPVVIGPAATNPLGASWGPDGTILFGQPEGILRVPAAGGTPELVIAAADGERMSSPQLMPNGDAVLFSVTTSDWDAAQVVVQSLSTGARTVLVEGGSDARYLPTGHLVYALDDGLFAVAFDADRLAVRGGPVSMIQGVIRARTSASANYGVSEDGTLVYLTGESAAAHTLVWVDREGREEPLAAPPRAYTYPRLSPDGTRVALDVRDEQNDIWIWDLARETLTRLTFAPGLDRAAAWTPDGRRVASSSQRDGAAGSLFWQAADGTGAAEPLSDSPGATFPQAFSPEGDQLLFTAPAGEGGGWDIGIVSTQGEHSVTPLIETPAHERNAELSPDGQRVAYESDESGQFEVYVRPFPNVEEGRWLVSRDGGTRPLWALDGRELFYLGAPGQVMAVPIQPGPAFAAGNPEQLFEGPYLEPSAQRTYDVSPDGQRFLMIKSAETAESAAAGPTLVVVQNWHQELLERVPIP